jgi:hypothetical protein
MQSATVSDFGKAGATDDNGSGLVAMKSTEQFTEFAVLSVRVNCEGRI